MQVGRFRDRVTIQARTTTNDGGSMVSSFTSRIATGWGTSRVPCEVASATQQDMERIFGQQADVVATHTVTLHTWREIAQTDRILWHTGRTTPAHVGVGAGDRVLEVKAITELGADRRFMVLACEERAEP